MYSGSTTNHATVAMRHPNKDKVVSDLRDNCSVSEPITVAHSTPSCPRKSEGDVVELADGRLLLVYMEFFGDGSDLAQTRLVAQESDDGGMSWSGYRVLVETAPEDINAYSPNLIRGLNGDILMLFMRQHSSVPPRYSFHVWRSKDEGKSFVSDTQFANRQNHQLCHATIKRLDSGRLLLPTSPAATESNTDYGHVTCCTSFYSDDDGRTWQEASNRVYLPMRGAMEPHAEQTRDGRVLMVMRNQLGSIFLAESHDEGATWNKPQTTGLRTPESCPELVRIPDTGHLLMIWNNSSYNPDFASHYGKRSPLTTAVSCDEGRTWINFRNIENDPGRAFSNPGCRFTRRGHAVINYWTCEYLPDWRMQDVIDLRVAVLESRWFYEKGSRTA